MDWLNLYIPTALRSPEYIGSSPAERGTWLSVLAYACQLECSGRLTGAALWKDRQWQQACGVTLREVRASSRLLKIEGSDVIVNGYPMSAEKQAATGRKHAKAAAMARWGKKVPAAQLSNAQADAQSTPLAIPPVDALREGEGEVKGEGEGPPPPPPSLSEAQKAWAAKTAHIARALVALSLGKAPGAVDEWAAACDNVSSKTNEEDLAFMEWTVTRLRTGGMKVEYARDVTGTDMPRAWGERGRLEWQRGLKAKGQEGAA